MIRTPKSITSYRPFPYIRGSEAKQVPLYGTVAQWELKNSLVDRIASRTLTNTNMTFSEDTNFPFGKRYVAIGNGSNSNLAFSTSGLPSGSSAFSLCAWYKAITTDNQCIIHLGTRSNLQEVWIAIDSGNGGKVVGCTYTDSEFSTCTRIGGWHHVAITYAGGTSGAFLFYVDGLLESSGTRTMNLGSTYGYIGYLGSVGYYWNGSISDVRIFNRALSASEILNIYFGKV